MGVGCGQSDSYDQLKEDKMGGSCSTHESDDKCMFGQKIGREERDHMGDGCIKGRIVLEWMFKKTFTVC
jgi:hypothetical protein